MISNDIQGLVMSAMQDIVNQNDPYKIPSATQKLNEVNKLVASL